LKLPRPSIPLQVQLHAALLQLGLDPAHADLDHDPALGLRKRSPDGKDYIPAANDPRYLVWRDRKAHRTKTSGTKATSAGSDVHLIAKGKRIRRVNAEAQRRILAQRCRRATAAIPVAETQAAIPQHAQEANMSWNDPTRIKEMEAVEQAKAKLSPMAEKALRELMALARRQAASRSRHEALVGELAIAAFPIMVPAIDHARMANDPLVTVDAIGGLADGIGSLLSILIAVTPGPLHDMILERAFEAAQHGSIPIQFLNNLRRR
jgi:hypothetical protein